MSSGYTDVNLSGILLPLLARTTTAQAVSPLQLNAYGAKGVMFFLNVTTIPGSNPSLAPVFSAADPVTSTTLANMFNTITPITGTGLYVYQLYPGVGSGTGALGITLEQNGVLPRSWIASVTHGNTNSVTYSLSYCLIP